MKRATIIICAVCLALTASSQLIERPLKNCENIISTFQIRQVGNDLFSSRFPMGMSQLPVQKNAFEINITTINCEQKNLRAYVLKDNFPKYQFYSSQTFLTRGILVKRIVFGGCWAGGTQKTTYYYFTPIHFDLL